MSLNFASKYVRIGSWLIAGGLTATVVGSYLAGQGRAVKTLIDEVKDDSEKVPETPDSQKTVGVVGVSLAVAGVTTTLIGTAYIKHAVSEYAKVVTFDHESFNMVISVIRELVTRMGPEARDTLREMSEESQASWLMRILEVGPWIPILKSDGSYSVMTPNTETFDLDKIWANKK